MALAPWLRDRLWRVDDWSGELARLRAAHASDPKPGVDRTWDLACATEHCDPDRSRALALYTQAWRAGHAPAKARTQALARVLRAHMTLAEIAAAEGEYLAAAAAFIDAGFPELAVDPLQKLVSARPPAASVASENLRLQGVAELLAIARRERFDAERVIDDALEYAQHASGRDAAAAYVHAARIARAAQLDARRSAVLLAAGRACPDDDLVALLVEEHLLERNDATELLAFYRGRFERAATRAEYAERVRAAGVELISRNLQPGLGLRLLRLNLDTVYAEKLPGVKSHLAVWELMVTHARAQDSLHELLPLIEQALAATVAKDDVVYLARLGLETASRSGDLVAARSHASTVLELVADHPRALAFVAALPASERPPDLPVVRFASGPAPLASSKSPPPAPESFAKASSRIPALEDAPVKRAEVSQPQHPHRISGRMALLTPRPPRIVASEAAAPSPSPSPERPVRDGAADAAPSPVTAPQPRAPRKVVPIDVVVELAGGGFFTTVVRDLSASGAFIVTKRALEVGIVLTLELQLPVPGTIAQTAHRVDARVARRTDVGVGVAFVDASPELVAAIQATTE